MPGGTPSSIEKTIMSSTPFKNRVVAITGGASDICLAIGRKFAWEGAEIALIDMDQEALDWVTAQSASPLFKTRNPDDDPVHWCPVHHYHMKR